MDAPASKYSLLSNHDLTTGLRPVRTAIELQRTNLQSLLRRPHGPEARGTGYFYCVPTSQCAAIAFLPISVFGHRRTSAL